MKSKMENIAIKTRKQMEKYDFFWGNHKHVLYMVHVSFICRTWARVCACFDVGKE